MNNKADLHFKHRPGAPAPLGMHLCRAVLERGDKVLATVPTDEAASYVSDLYGDSYGEMIVCFKITSDTTYSQIRSKIRAGMDQLKLRGKKIDYLIHCPSFVSPRGNLRYGVYCYCYCYCAERACGN